MDGCHPRVELLVEATRQESDVGAPHGHQWPVDGEAFVSVLFDDLIEPCRDGEDRLAGACAAVERDHCDVGVEEQFEGEALFLAARVQAPGFGCVV